MQPPLFYIPNPTIEDALITLPADEARHAARVLRLGLGAIVIVVDGAGNAYRSEVASVTGRKTTVRVHSEVRDFGEPSVHLTLAAGLSTRLKFDTVVQKGTELGVSRLVPLITEKSKVVIDDPKRARTKTNRWTKVAVASMKQARRSCLPQVTAPIPLADFLSRYDPADTGLIFHPGKGSVPMDTIDFSERPKRVTLVVGPESGFSDEEILLAESSGLRAVSLGRRVLRTETAGPVAVALVMVALGEFR